MVTLVSFPSCLHDDHVFTSDHFLLYVCFWYAAGVFKNEPAGDIFVLLTGVSELHLTKVACTLRRRQS